MSPEALTTVIVPCRNEFGHIETLLRSVLSQEGAGNLEVLIADGLSDDGTLALLEESSRRDDRIRIIRNPEKIVSTGLNRAIREARGDVIVRMDVHSVYAPDYIARCRSTLESTGADNVGGPWQARGFTTLQVAIAIAFQSPFSSGGAGSHRVNYEGPVDSVYLGCWRKATLLRIGLFDEGLVRNQDDELNLRICRAGGTVWQTPAIQSWYVPRSSLIGLFKQYQQYGYWKVRVIQKHRLPASIRHLVPGAFVASLLLLLVLSTMLASARWLLGTLLGLYAAACLTASARECRRRTRWRYIAILPAVFGAYHFGYGWGFLRGAIDFVMMGRKGRTAYERLTR
jgi:glycosyltransferase involved in cell wall biosynthesis